MSTGSTLARRTGLDPGCGHGRRYRDQEAAERARAGDEAREALECSSRPGTWHLAPVVRVPSLVRNVPLERGTGKIAPRRKTGTASGLRLPPPGFTSEVELQIRTRAGNGNPAQALCEAHGDFLGIDGGDLQHVVARGMGGCRDAVINSAAGGILLCRPAHDFAEARSPLMKALGFWLPQGTDPRQAAMTLYGLNGGTARVWRPETGTAYLTEQPGTEAAA